MVTLDAANEAAIITHVATAMTTTRSFFASDMVIFPLSCTGPLHSTQPNPIKQFTEEEEDFA